MEAVDPVVRPPGSRVDRLGKTPYMPGRERFVAAQWLLRRIASGSALATQRRPVGG
jgi:hypothetical protein